MPGDLGKPECSACGGSGWLRIDVPVGHEFFGKLFECECQSGTLAARRAGAVQKYSQMSDHDRRLSWDDITITTGMMKGFTAVRKTLRLGHGWVYLWGPSGPGKTLLAKAAVAESLRAGQSAVFVMWADMLDHIRRGIDAGDVAERLEQWRSVPLLAIDEYGRANNTGWVDEIRARVFVPRHEAAIEQRSITLFTSNFAPDRVDNGDMGWLYDRLRDGRYDVLERDDGQGGIVEVSGPSMRPTMRYDPAEG